MLGFNRQHSRHAGQTKKQTNAQVCLILIFGGGEGNRTPVRKKGHKGFSERSRCLGFAPNTTPSGRLRWRYLDEVPIRASENWPLGILLVDALAQAAGDPG